MKKFLKGFIAIFCVAAMIVALGACNKNDETEPNEGPVEYTVTFNSNGGTPVASVKVYEGDTVERPDDPTLENYVFVRWLNNGRMWDFNLKQVKSNITLDALWISATNLFGLEGEENGDGIVITEIKRQDEFHTMQVPEVINGKTVVAIGAGGCSSITSKHAETVVFPATVTSVGESAFAEISEVQLIFQGTITSIAESSFENCLTLTQISLGEGIKEIPYRAFFGCSALKTINIPNGTEKIKENAFEDCKSMITLVLPSTLTSVENGAFKDCDALKTVFFGGTKAQFDAITVADGNTEFKNAAVSFYSEEKPTAEGSFWHYDKNNNPILW